MKESLDNFAFSNPDSIKINQLQKVALFIGLSGLFILFLAPLNPIIDRTAFLTYGLSAIFAGIITYSFALYKNKSAGIKNNAVWHRTLSNRGLVGWIIGVFLTTFYIVLYFFPAYLGLSNDGSPNSGIIALFDPLSNFLSGRNASQWFVYGTLYTLAILAFGIKFFWKYRHNRYQLIRTSSLVFFQTAFAFLIPEFMARLNGDLPYYDLKNVWPLNYYNFEEYRISGFLENGNIGLFMLFFGIASIFIITPILTYFYGKRWYCSWVCGCGGLAETAGDSFRQLSDKSEKAWKIERWLVHSVLVFVTIMTVAVIATYLGYNTEDGTSKYWLGRDAFLIGVAVFSTAMLALVLVFKRNELKKDAKYGAVFFLVFIVGLIVIHYLFNQKLFLFDGHQLSKWYGFFIGSIFSGVIGTGFYPILGNRVWCRFGCPMAAFLGLQQRLFSRFRITTNGGQCISCGNCSTYCEMGIDVRAYAQKGENIVRASCVGCGICAAVCPRGVLKLENGNEEKRTGGNGFVMNNVNLLNQALEA